jgi:hypothetical protein
VKLHIFELAEPGLFCVPDDCCHDYIISSLRHILLIKSNTCEIIDICIFTMAQYQYWNVEKGIWLYSYPMASTEELAENSDNCAICWEKMETARKLPCTHLFHKYVGRLATVSASFLFQFYLFLIIVCVKFYINYFCLVYISNWIGNPTFYGSRTACVRYKDPF